MERQSSSPEKQRAFSRKSLLLAACMAISGSTSAAALAIAQSGCGSFSSADTEQEAGSNEGGNDGGGSGTDSGNVPDVGVVVDAGEAGVDASDPCATAVVDGFPVTLKALPSNRFDFALYRGGTLYKESVSNGVAEASDVVITPVNYDDVLVVQSMPDVSGAPEVEKYAMEDVVGVPAGCINQETKTRELSSYNTLTLSSFYSVYNMCSGCSMILSTGVKPTFHYEYRIPSYLSTAYHITFKKP